VAYDAAPYRRRVDVEERLPGEVIVFKTKSFRLDDGTRYHPTIDKQTGGMS
jgi:hypothetical protein